LGFETICVAAANDATVLEDGFDSEDLPLVRVVSVLNGIRFGRG
jgi:hypothetical protein